jgi:dTDP-4-dehydrorhamnose 3,5-epimerase
MALKCTEKSLPSVFLIEPMVFGDDRGFFLETYHWEKYLAIGMNKPFVQDNHSHSCRGTLRGLHYQLKHPQGKLVYVIRGEVFDVAVDIRSGSSTFGQWTGTILSEKNKHQLFIPEGFAHGLCVISETADVVYKCTDLYAPGDEYGILWSDPAIGIDWPVQHPILSEKDAESPRLMDVPAELLPKFYPKACTTNEGP